MIMSEYIIAGKVDRWDGLATGIVAGEIVRCRDCVYMDEFHPFDIRTGKPSEHAEYTCESNQFSNWDFPIEVDPDGFCAWGERREP